MKCTMSAYYADEQDCRSRLLGRPRHELHRQLAEGGLYGFDEVVAVLVDVGQEFDLDESIERGRAAGADDVVLVDRKAAFAEEQCAQAIKTNALYEGKYPLVSALSRPVIAQAVAEVARRARRRGRRARLHGQGQRPAPLRARLQGALPGLRVIAPLRDRIWTRDEEIDYALAKGIPVTATADVAVLDRREPLRPGDRGRRARGSVGARRRRSRTRSPAIRRRRPRRSRSTIGFEAGSPGLARRRGAAARRADRAAERARRPVRDRADRHDREPRRRDQEPRGLRGAGRDRPDPGALGARGRRADEGRGPDQARPRAALDGARLRGPLVQPGARGDRRVRRQDAGARRRRRAGRAAAERRRRHRPPLAAHALRGAARVVRHRRDVPPRGGRGLHRDLLAGGGAGGRPRAGEDQA